MIKFDEQEIHSLLRLISVPGIGSFRIRKLVAHFNSASAVLKADAYKIAEIAGIDKVLALKISKENDTRFADFQIQTCRKLNINILSFFSENYPAPLKQTPDPPILLFTKGTIIPEDVIALGIVGSRMPSDYGRRATEKFARELAQAGFSIVSGLARGIDTVAHQTCVKLGSRTLAVLGSGLDIIYPPENKTLARHIIDNGAIITELSCGSKPDAVNFPKRNRIISGLSLGVLIVEAGAKSGALITATSALNQNREIFAVPGNLFSMRNLGSNRLIKEGEKLVQSIDDLLVGLEGSLRPLAAQKTNFKIQPRDLSETEKKIWDVLSDDPVHIDLISQQTGLSTSEVLSILLTLELKDLVSQQSGKMFTRI